MSDMRIAITYADGRLVEVDYFEDHDTEEPPEAMNLPTCIALKFENTVKCFISRESALKLMESLSEALAEEMAETVS